MKLNFNIINCLIFKNASKAPAASLAEEIDIVYLSYSFPSTLLSVSASQNIELDFDILRFYFLLAELFYYHLVLIYYKNISQEDIGTHLNYINTYLANALAMNA